MRAFAFDIDGVLLRSATALPRARESLLKLQRQQVPFILLTNGGGTSEGERLEKLQRLLDVPLDRRQLVQSHTPFREHPRRYGYKHVLVCGGVGDACRRLAEDEYGFTKVTTPLDMLADDPTLWPYHTLTPAEKESTRALPRSPIDALYVYHDPRDWGLDATAILDILRGHHRLGKSEGMPRKLPLYFSNPDLLWASAYEGGPRMGQGAFRDLLCALWKSTGDELRLAGDHAHDKPAARADPLEYVQYGKPTKHTYSFAERVLREIAGGEVEQVYMVGDNPSSDIRGAIDYGWVPVLVRTGVFKGSDREALDKVGAHHIAKGVGEAVDWALSTS
ncbi:hypothetical protein PYCC9005_005779 [Savitreella phatthalungensis]